MLIKQKTKKKFHTFQEDDTIGFVVVHTQELSPHHDVQLEKPDPLAQYSHLHRRAPASLTPSHYPQKHVKKGFKLKRKSMKNHCIKRVKISFMNHYGKSSTSSWPNSMAASL
jgi:hypothetical protein